MFARWIEDSSFRPSTPLLREAFEHYGQAAVASSGDERARSMLFANIKCGLHEQGRLQPEIEAALIAPLSTLSDLTRTVRAVLFGSGGSTRRPVEGLELRDRDARVYDLEASRWATSSFGPGSGCADAGVL